MNKIPIEELIGKKYGMLEIMAEVNPHIKAGGQIERKMFCKCDCGQYASIKLGQLRIGHTKSCGCRERMTHGLTNHPLMDTWYNMKQRCYYPKSTFYKRYGERGIKVCDEWKNSFISFYNWAIKNGWSKELKIDRIENDGNYEPSNCQFVTNKVNCRNTSRTLLNEDVVKKIIQLRKDTGWGRKKIADALGLTVGAVGGVIYRNTWD
jgi:hypothetical protein